VRHVPSRIIDRPTRDEAVRRTAAAPDPAATVRTGRLAFALLVSAVVVGLYSVHAAMPANAVSLPYEDSLRQPIRQVLPQGWSFFTRAPREPDLLPFVRGADGQWRDALRAPHSEPRNVFGLARGSRTQGIEMGVLTSAVAADEWRDCRGPIAACLDRTPAIAVTNPTLAPTLCGEVGLANQPPPPWAWSRSGKSITMPSTVIRLVVSC
jgi:antimicrobial peptide system SdpA family protein